MAVTDTNNTSAAGAKDQAFFAEEASRQILVRVASVLQDPDLCDATFVVEDGNEKEEIKAPTQFMAMSSPYFKSILYPMQEVQRKEVNGMQPKTFRKILDYLFRGRVPLSSIEDAWKIKVAGKIFQLKELEELCTKFLQYRIDSRNLIHFLKNTTKYNTTDLRDVVITRFLKNADKGFEDEQMLDLTEGEMFDIMSRRPEVQARKIMEVLIKWAKKRYFDKKAEIEKAKRLEEEKKAEEKRQAEKRAEEDRIMEQTRLAEEKEAEAKKTGEKEKDEPKKEDSKMEEDKVESEAAKKEDDKTEETKSEEKKETTSEEKKEDSKEDESKMDVDKKEDAKKAGGLFGFFSKGEKSDEKQEKKDDEKKDDDAKKEDEKKGEDKKDDKSVEKKSDEKKEGEKKEEEKKTEDDDIVEIKKTEEKPVEVEEIDLIPALEKLVTFLKWDHTDAPYYLKEVRSHQIMSQEHQNEALTQMLQSFVDKQGKTPAQPASKETASKIGPRSATTRGGSPHAPSFNKGQ